MGRSFNDWWNTVPADLKEKARRGDENNKPLLNQVNYVLLHLHLSGNHKGKPNHNELLYWINNGQIDISRFSLQSKKSETKDHTNSDLSFPINGGDVFGPDPIAEFPIVGGDELLSKKQSRLRSDDFEPGPTAEFPTGGGD